MFLKVIEMHFDIRIKFSVLIAICVIAGGCSGGNEAELLPVQKVQGTLTYQGKPMDGAVVIFFPNENGLYKGCPRAISDESGHYQLTTFNENDGAPAGDYKVTIYWPEGGADPETADPLPPDRLNKVYADIKTTKLTASVSNNSGDIDFALPPK